MSVDHVKAAVRRAYPEAKVIPDGMLFAVVNGADRLGSRGASSDSAWVNAYNLIKANQP